MTSVQNFFTSIVTCIVYAWTYVTFKILLALQFLIKTVVRASPPNAFPNITAPIEIAFAADQFENDITYKFKWILYLFWDKNIGDHGGIFLDYLKDCLDMERIFVIYINSSPERQTVLIDMEKKTMKYYSLEKDIKKAILFNEVVFE